MLGPSISYEGFFLTGLEVTGLDISQVHYYLAIRVTYKIPIIRLNDFSYLELSSIWWRGQKRKFKHFFGYQSEAKIIMIQALQLKEDEPGNQLGLLDFNLLLLNNKNLSSLLVGNCWGRRIDGYLPSIYMFILIGAGYS